MIRAILSDSVGRDIMRVLELDADFNGQAQDGNVAWQHFECTAPNVYVLWTRVNNVMKNTHSEVINVSGAREAVWCHTGRSILRSFFRAQSAIFR